MYNVGSTCMCLLILRMSKIGEGIGSMRHKMSDVIASKFDLVT